MSGRSRSGVYVLAFSPIDKSKKKLFEEKRSLKHSAPKDGAESALFTNFQNGKVVSSSISKGNRVHQFSNEWFPPPFQTRVLPRV